MENYIRQGILADKELFIILKELKKIRKYYQRAGLYSNTGSNYNPDIRSGLIAFSEPQLTYRTFNILQTLILEIYSNIDFDFTNISSIQMAKYDVGQKFTWHHDVIPVGGNDNNILRSFTMSLNISDESEYEGGELLVKHNNQIIQCDKKQGSYIIFPSFLYHQASEVKKGTRESLVVWSQSHKNDIEALQKNYESKFGRSFQEKESINIT